MDTKSKMIAQAMLGAPAAPALDQPENPFILDPGLEQAAQPGNVQMNPLVHAIAKHLGLMSLIRNRSNQGMADPNMPVLPQ